MKKHIRSFSGFVAFLAASLLLIGCTSTSTSRSSGEYLDDQAVNARVKAALLADDDVSGFDVSTTTYDGVVQLSGFVDTAAQRYRAERVAEEVSGVQSVVNNITVNPRDTEFGGREADEMEPSSEAPAREAQEAQSEMEREAHDRRSEPQRPRANDEDLREPRPLN
ncbi:MAG TPA: BON domain-containing protein [Opitutales bacterium]|nr:BON domain-containing protein [Opitutales bacterium]